MQKDWQKKFQQSQRRQHILSSLYDCLLIAIIVFWEPLPSSNLLRSVLIFLAVLLIPWLEILFHEFGHMIFGRLSGYRFGFFVVFNHIWLKRDGKSMFCCRSISGAANRCVMYAPDAADPPVYLFFLGGVLMDALSMLLFGLLALPTYARIPYLALCFLLQAANALYSILNNLLPQNKLIHSDGHQLRALRKTPAARQALLRTHRIHESLHLQNIRLRDMPEEWFALPDEKEWQNCMLAGSALYYAYRLLDAHRFSEAYALMQRILSGCADLSVTDRIQLTASCASAGLLTGASTDEVRKLLDLFMRKQMKDMSALPGILCSVYICSLLLDDNPAKAAEARKDFEGFVSKTPCTADLEIDREMMDMAFQIYEVLPADAVSSARKARANVEPVIRKASYADLDAIAEIYSDIHNEIEAGRADIGWVRDIYPTRKTARNAIYCEEMFVMEEDGAIVAAARINQTQGPEYDGASWSFPADPDEVMVLHTLVVAPHEKGRGLGAKFVAFYENHARAQGCTALRIDTNAINRAARALYKKLGYTEACIVPCNFNGIPGVNLVCLDKKL